MPKKKPMNPHHIEHILDEMFELYKDFPLTELVYETPFQCLIAVLLSAQTTDKQVNKVTKHLFQVVREPQDVLDIGHDQLGEYIRTVGLWRSKQKNLMKTSAMLVHKTDEMRTHKGSEDNKIEKNSSKSMQPDRSKHEIEHDLISENSREILKERGYRLPDSLEGMMELAGVGEKTAKVVLYILYGQLWVAVDTHVHRVMNRLGVVSTKSPEQTSKVIETIIPDSYKDIAHRSIIYFGRYLCKAKKPECERCPLVEFCHFYPNYLKNVGKK